MNAPAQNAPDPHRELELTWIDNPQDLAPLREEWRALAERVEAEIFLQPDWIDVWWSHFGGRKQLACLVVRQAGRLVGVLPFAIERIGLGPLSFRVARLVGTDPYSIVLGLPVEEAWTGTVLEVAVTHLTGTYNCLAVSFSPVSDRAGYGSALRDLGREGTGLALREEPAGGHVIFELPDQFEAFLQRLSRNRRSQFRRRMKALQQAFDTQADCIVPTAAEFDEFIALHNRQWQAAGKGGHFVDWPGSGEFYRDLAVRTADRRFVQLDRLTGNTGPLAAELSMVSGRTAHWHLPARSLDPEAERLSSGMVIFLTMIERFIRDGITLMEAGRGNYGYKIDLGGHMVDLHRLILYPDRPGAGARLKLLLGWANLLDFFYYRAWFLKLSPRVRKMTGRRPRPLWRSWIRTRV